MSLQTTETCKVVYDYQNFSTNFFYLDSDSDAQPLATFRVRPRPDQPLPAAVTAIISTISSSSDESEIINIPTVNSAISHTSPTTSIISGKNHFHYIPLFSLETSIHFLRFISYYSSMLY